MMATTTTMATGHEDDNGDGVTGNGAMGYTNDDGADGDDATGDKVDDVKTMKDDDYGNGRR